MSLALAVFGGGLALGAEQAALPTISTADFSAADFGDCKRLAQFLADEGPDFPVSRRLRPEVQESLRFSFWKGQAVPEQMRRQIADDFNAMLSDRSLFREIRAFYASRGIQLIGATMTEVFFPEDRRLLCWLVRLLEAEGIFDPKRTEIPPPAGAQLRALNHIFLMTISREDPRPASEEPPIILPHGTSGEDQLFSPIRLAMLQPERVVDHLGIQPGMVVADIGAGYGVFTFPLADALKHTGQVYATDISRDAVADLNAKAASGGYKNVTAVKVEPEGVQPFLDLFYRGHAFDRILVVDVYQAIADPVSYFDELRLSLKPRIGRLHIIIRRPDPDLAELEFGDFKNVLKTLAAKGERFPVYRRLKPEIREYLKSWHGQEVPAGLRRGIIDDFNTMLSEKFLFKELEDSHDDSARIGSFPLASWLVAQLRAEGIFARESRPLSPLARKELHRLNRILLTRIFQTYVWRDTLLSDYAFLPEKETIVRQLSTAGYSLARDDDGLLPYFYVLEFKRAR